MREPAKPFRPIRIDLLRPVVPALIVAELAAADRDPLVGNNDGMVDEAELRAVAEAQPELMNTFDYDWSVAEAYDRRNNAPNDVGEIFLRFGAWVILVIGMVRWAREGFAFSYERLAPMLNGEKLDTTMTMIVVSIIVLLFVHRPRRRSSETPPSS